MLARAVSTFPSGFFSAALMGTVATPEVPAGEVALRGIELDGDAADGGHQLIQTTSGHLSVTDQHRIPISRSRAPLAAHSIATLLSFPDFFRRAPSSSIFVVIADVAAYMPFDCCQLIH